MGTSRISYAAPFSRLVVSSSALAREPFVVIDVGASGGIAQHWRIFEPHLHAFGFDPLIKECARLNREERNEHVRYIDGYLGFDDYARLFPPDVATDAVGGWSNQPFARTSAARAQKMQNVSYDQWLNNDPEVIYSTRRSSIDAFFSDHPEESVDFIKVDTDGSDYEVLNGATKVIEERKVLGFFVECQFHGITHPHSNLFANIDRFMRERGFSLFDMEFYRYTRGVLPGRFVWSIGAQTREGQVIWGDALYLRDAAAPGYEQRWAAALSPPKLLKLACLFEIYGMPDCAAELLLHYRQELDGLIDVQAALDLFTREIDPGAEGFEKHNARFDQFPESFYPRHERQVRQYAPSSLRKVLSGAKRRFVEFLIRRV